MSFPCPIGHMRKAGLSEARARLRDPYVHVSYVQVAARVTCDHKLRLRIM